PDGRVVILDFGVAIDVAEALAHSGEAIAGTVLYMAPEQVAGRPFDAAADWYAVGVMLYEALTGRRPFEGSVADIVSKKMRADATRPAALGRDIEPALDELCCRLLARVPRERAGAADIRRWAGQRPSSEIAQPTRLAEPGAFVGRDTELASLEQAF